MNNLSSNELATIEALKLMVGTASAIRLIDGFNYGQSAGLAYVQYELAHNLAIKCFGFEKAKQILKEIDEGEL